MTISGGINFSGIGNGTDFSQIVDKLKEVESIPMKRMEAWKADWNKRYEAFGEIINAVRAAQENLTKLNSPQKFLAKIASSSNENVLSAKAGADAVDGTHSIEVKQLASNSIWAYNDNFASKTTKVNDTGVEQEFSYTYKGKTRTIKVPNNTTLEGLTNLVNQDKGNLGVKMSMIQTADGYTVQVAGKESGKDASLLVHPSGMTAFKGGNMTWEGSAAIPDMNATLDSFGSKADHYTYMVTLADGSTKTVELMGNETQGELQKKLAGAGLDATIVNNNLQIKGAVSVETTIREGGSGGTVKSTSSAKGSATTSVGVTGATLDSKLMPDGKVFKFTVETSAGKTITGELPPGATQQDYINALNAMGEGISASVVPGSGPGNYTVNIGGVQKITGDPDSSTSSGFVGGTTAPDPSWNFAAPAKADSVIQSGAIAKDLTYTFKMADGTTKAVKIDSSSSIQELIDKISTDVPEANISVTGGVVKMDNVFSVSGGPGLDGKMTGTDTWTVREAKDAIFKVDNWPQELTSSSNEVSNVLEGVTLTLKDKGTTQITISSDRDSVKENIQTVLDTINSVVKKVQDLSKWDKDKATVDTSSKGDKINYGSQFSSQKGGVLTGNYGVQLFSTRLKGAMTGAPPGFANRADADDIFSGDFVAALAQMGIKTNAVEGDPNYGLFMIAPSGSSDTMQALDQERFDDAIANHLDEVISFFSSDDVGGSSSPDFRYNSHIKGMTKAGSYSVNYEVDGAGNILDVFINGVKASKSDKDSNTYTVTNAGDASGMSIIIDDLSAGPHKGQVSIKQGKVRQMEDFLAAETVYHKPNVNDPGLSSTNGGLMILQANYMDIMNNIDKKIEREQTRLSKWERTQRLAFSRLETVLGQYERNMQTLNSQMGQLQSG